MGDLTLFEEGPLDKRGQGPLKQWKKYYCTLQNSKFSYRPYKETTSKELDMSTVHSVRAVRGKPGSNCNEIHFHLKGDKEVIFSAFNVADQERWVRGLQKAIEVKRKRESLRSSMIGFERGSTLYDHAEREATVYDSPWDLEAAVSQSNEKFKQSTKRSKSPMVTNNNGSGPPRVEPYAEVILFPKPKSPTDPVKTTIVAPYAEASEPNETDTPYAVASAHEPDETVTPYAETSGLNTVTSNDRNAGTIYSKCMDVKPVFAQNETSGYSYTQVIRPKIVEDLRAESVEKFHVSYSAYDSYIETGSDHGQRDSEVNNVSAASGRDSGNDPGALLSTLQEALGVFSALEKYGSPKPLKYLHCEKSASFVELKNHIATSKVERFTKPRSFRMGNYVRQLKESVCESSPTVQMEMAL